ncbi:unnamed protein product [Fusarium graminearum]|nr:unnamed protein product [Fusarium graminearum]
MDEFHANPYYLVPYKPDCGGLVHFDVSNCCSHCHETKPADKKAAVFYCKEFPVGTWKLRYMTISGGNHVHEDASMWREEGICWCNYAEDGGASGGFLLLHQECLALLNDAELSAERIDDVGRALAWMNTNSFLRGRKPLDFDTILGTQDYRHDSIAHVGQKLGLPLGRLPLELLQQIQSDCRDAPFWQRVKHSEVAPSFGTRPRTEAVTTSLASVVQWPIEAIYGCVRVMIDRHGFCQIEQLSEYPPVCLVRREFERFVILEMHHARLVSAYFKDGICWLGPWSADRIPTLWDIPSPPTRPIKYPETCSIMDWRFDADRFETINLSIIAGLCFHFDKHSKLKAIAFNKSAPLSHGSVVEDKRQWLYLPLASNDRILWIQFREECKSTKKIRADICSSVLVKTELCGVIHLGQHTRRPTDILAFSKAPRAIFCEPQDGKNIQKVVAFYPKSDPSSAHEVPGLEIVGTPTPDVFGDSPYCVPWWSWAPLEDIKCLHFFSRSCDGSFLGMHITYKNGGQRFVGDGDSNIHAARDEERIENPTWLFVEFEPGLGRRMSAIFYNDDSYKDEDKNMKRFLGDPERWSQHKLVGEFHYWHDQDPQHGDNVVQILPSGSWRGQIKSKRTESRWTWRC